MTWKFQGQIFIVNKEGKYNTWKSESRAGREGNIPDMASRLDLALRGYGSEIGREEMTKREREARERGIRDEDKRDDQGSTWTGFLGMKNWEEKPMS